MPFDVPIPATMPLRGLGRASPRPPSPWAPSRRRAGRSPSPRISPPRWWRPCRARPSRCRARPMPRTACATSGSTGTAPPGPPIRPVIATAAASVDDHPDHDAWRADPPPTSRAPTSCTARKPGRQPVLNDTTDRRPRSRPRRRPKASSSAQPTSRTSSPSPGRGARGREPRALADPGTPPMFLDTERGGGRRGRVHQPRRARLSTARERGRPHRDRWRRPRWGPPSPSSRQPVPLSRSHRAVPGDPGGFWHLRHALQRHAAQPDPLHRRRVRRHRPRRNGAFTAEGGPISSALSEVDLDVTEFGDNSGMFC